MSDDRMPSPDGRDADVGARRERVVQLVRARIAAAPHVFGTARGPVIDITAWTIPALAAAAVILFASVAWIGSIASEPAEPRTVVEALGLPEPLTQFVTTGQVDPWIWLFARSSQ